MTRIRLPGRRRVAYVAGLLLVVCGGIAVGVYLTREDDGGSQESVAGPSSSEGEPDSGPSRLREGARQIEDPATGLLEARRALARIETELAATRDQDEIGDLMRKKRLIEEAIDSLRTP